MIYIPSYADARSVQCERRLLLIYTEREREGGALYHRDTGTRGWMYVRDLFIRSRPLRENKEKEVAVVW